MYKVLIVEDEPVINESIKKMIEKLDNENCACCCAFDGDDAIEKLSKEKVDVVFTDIRMPGTNGIQLLEYIHQYYPYIVTVVISGYEIFDYAQKAMKYQALDYLLKPFSINDIREILNKIHKQLHIIEEQQKEKYARKILFAEKKDERKAEEGVYDYQLCLLNIGSCKMQLDDEVIAEEKYAEIEEYLEKRIIKCETGKVFYFRIHDVVQYILIGEIEKKEENKMHQFFREIYEDLTKRYLITMIASQTFADMNQLYEVFRMLRITMKEKLIFGFSSFLTCEYNKNGKRVQAQPSENECNYNVAEKGDMPRERIVKILQRCRDMKCTQMILGKRLKQEFIDIAGENSQKNKFSLEIIETELHDNLERSDTYEQLQEALFDMLNALYGDKQEGEKELIVAVKKYITKNMKMKLSMKELSSQFGFVPSYLSMIFREAEGKSPTEYLTDLRIENAKKLFLQSTDTAINEIAERVGFSDPLYFSKVFKKVTGITPSQYRNQMNMK